MASAKVKSHPKEFSGMRFNKVEPGQLRIFMGIVSGALYDFAAFLSASGYDANDLTNQLDAYAQMRQLDLVTTDPRFYDSAIKSNEEFEEYKRQNPSYYVVES